MNSDTGLVPIKIELFGIGTLEGQIIRYIAPLSADAIIDKIPFVMRGLSASDLKNIGHSPD